MFKKKTLLITLLLFLAESMAGFADVIVYQNDFEDPCQVDALSGWNWGDAGIAHNVAYVDYEGNTVVEHTGIIDANAAALTTRFGSKWGFTLSGNTSANPADYTIEFDVKSVSGDWDPIDLEFFVLTGGGNGVGYGSGASSYAQADGWVHVAANLADLSAGWWAGTAWDMTDPNWQIEIGGPPWPGVEVPAGTPAWNQIWSMDNFTITMTTVPVDPGNYGLVAYYALENDTTDSSGNGLDGVIEAVGGGDAPVYVTGLAGYGMAMDFLPTATGTIGSVVNCGADPNYFDFTDAITLGAWVNMRSIPDEWRAIIAKGDDTWRLSNVGADPRFHFGFCGYASRPTTHGIDGAIEVGFDEWHYVCGTYDITDGARLYVDGVLDVNVADTAGIAVNTNDVWIGGNNGDTGWKPYRLFDGVIDEVRIYNRALSQDEINRLVAPKYQPALPPLEEVEIVNASFELPGTTKQNCWDGGTNAKGTFEDVPGWNSDTMADDSGVESDSRYPATDGVWTGFLMAGDPSVWNLTSHLIASDEDFVLSVDARNTYTATPPALLTMSLYCDVAGTRLAMVTKTVELTDEMATYTLSLSADTAAAARDLPIGIELKNDSASGSWIGIDNVHLTID